MPVLRLNPHKLSVLFVRDGYEDGNGDWHQGELEWGEPVDCHAIPAGQANQITFNDGTTANYSYTIGGLNPNMEELKIGDRVLLIIGNDKIEYSVKGFHRYQLQCKIWI